MDLDALCLQVSNKSGLSDGASHPDRAFLVQAANKGTQQMLMDTHLVVTSTIQGVSAGDTSFTLAGVLLGQPLALLEVNNASQADGGSALPLVRVTAQEVHDRNRGGMMGAPRYYSMIGFDLFEFAPIADNIYEFNFWYVATPDDMVDGGDTPGDGTIPIFAHRAIELWMMIEASEKLHNFDAVQYYQGLYDKECGKIRREARNMGGRRAAQIQVGYLGSVPIGPRRNDVYSSDC